MTLERAATGSVSSWSDSRQWVAASSWLRTVAVWYLLGRWLCINVGGWLTTNVIEVRLCGCPWDPNSGPRGVLRQKGIADVASCQPAAAARRTLLARSSLVCCAGRGGLAHGLGVGCRLRADACRPAWPDGDCRERVDCARQMPTCTVGQPPLSIHHVAMGQGGRAASGGRLGAEGGVVVLINNRPQAAEFPTGTGNHCEARIRASLQRSRSVRRQATTRLARRTGGGNCSAAINR
jgi:hypothetical protein